MRKVVTVTAVGAEEKKRGEKSGKMRGASGGRRNPFKPTEAQRRAVLKISEGERSGGQNGTEISNLSFVGGDTPGARYRTK